MGTRQERTEVLIDEFRGNRDEFMMLKGVLCMSHGLRGDDAKVAGALFDTIKIAERMDEINREAVAAFRSKAAA